MMTAQEYFKKLNFGKRKEFLSVILNTKYPSRTVPQWERDFFELVINSHHRSHGDTVIHTLNIVPNMSYGNTHNNFYADYTAFGENIKDVIGIGSTLAATPKRDPVEVKRKKCKQFMRWVIGWHTSSLRMEEVKNNPQCKLCGVPVTYQTSHLDHCGDYEFRHLADIWLDDIIDQITLVKCKDNCDAFQSDNHIDEWVTFHNAAMKYQLLCPPCNLKKSKV